MTDAQRLAEIRERDSRGLSSTRAALDRRWLLTQLAERERMLAEADAVIWELSNGGITDADEDPRFVGALARHRERQNG